MAVCNACKKWPHDSKPEDCRGGTWCDCHHRLPIVRTMVESEAVNLEIEEKNND